MCDFTYCSTWSGIVYVAFVTDVFSRRIVGWNAARTMTTTLVTDAIDMAESMFSNFKTELFKNPAVLRDVG